MKLKVITEGNLQTHLSENLLKKYKITCTTVSLYFSQANGAAESAVKIAKKILRQADIFLALMTYRSTPIGVSPAERLMGRKNENSVTQSPK